MQILVINCGSSSIKADIIDTLTKKSIFELDAERINTSPEITINKNLVEYNGEINFKNILQFCFQKIKNDELSTSIVGIGHRVVHGGDVYQQPVLIDEHVEKIIEDLCSLAPLHNPANLAGIQEAKEIFPTLPNVAVFDTAFHQTIPNRAKYYAIDKAFADSLKIKRYGFHGTSHKYVAEKASNFLQTDLKNLRIISCHLGNGASVCAIEYGRSVETSMGFTPIEGLSLIHISEPTRPY